MASNNNPQAKQSENQQRFAWESHDYIVYRVRQLYQTICKWKGKHADIKLRLLMYLRELGEQVNQLEMDELDAEALDDWFENFRFKRNEMPRPPIHIRRPCPVMTLDQAAERVSETENWQSVEDLEPPATRRRLNFDSPAISTPDLPICARCYRNVYECQCAEAQF